MHDDESFFREVDEDYQREQFIKLLQRYGPYIVGAAFVVVAVVAGYSIERRQTAKEAARGGDAYINAITLFSDGKVEDAQRALAALAKDGPANYKVIARLRIAADAVAKNDHDGAIAAYREVAGNAAAPKNLRDFAKVQLAALSVNTESYAKLSEELKTYRSGTSPWRFSAKEVLGLAAMKAGDKKNAQTLFGEIMSDGSAPESMRQRAQVMLALLVEKPKVEAAGTAVKGNAPNDAKTQ